MARTAVGLLKTGTPHGATTSSGKSQVNRSPRKAEAVRLTFVPIFLKGFLPIFVYGTPITGSCPRSRSYVCRANALRECRGQNTNRDMKTLREPPVEGRRSAGLPICKLLGSS